MADLETQPGKESVAAFIKAIEDPTRRRDCQALNALMKRVTAKRPLLWGGNMVGFGRYEYRYASGHEGAWFITGFSPRKRDLTVYVMNGSDHEIGAGHAGAVRVQLINDPYGAR
jgi:hypothetical protein